MRFINTIITFAAAVSAAAVPAPQTDGECNVRACGAELIAAGVSCATAAASKFDLAECATLAGIALFQINGCEHCAGDPLGFTPEGTCTRSEEYFCPPVGQTMIGCISRCQNVVFVGQAPIGGQDYCRGACADYCGCS